VVGVRFGGVDPSILRELSGVYKPFVKAFKELVSNAFDADADTVEIKVSDDFAEIEVVDDGCGMSPFEFRSLFARIGGGNRKVLGDKTPRGRRRIGSKGIGFLAMARYCSALDVESQGKTPFTSKHDVAETPTTLSIANLVGFELPPELLEVLSVEITQVKGRIGTLVPDKHYKLRPDRGDLRIQRPVGAVQVKLTAPCEDVRFCASLDFDHLLELADRADLDKLDDFATIEFLPAERKRRTNIRLRGLKSFVRRDLRSARRKGNVRNVGSRSGFEQFLWHLSRCTPVAYAHGQSRRAEMLLPVIETPPKSTLRRLTVSHNGEERSLRRPIYPLEEDALPLHSDMLIPVTIDDGSLKAKGFLAGYSGVIFPAEYRGFTVRVRGVAIGQAGFLGAENDLTGASRAALSQITGEINVFEGLDAVDALNPGRESFYEENPDYKLLRQKLVGEGERVSGFLGEAIRAVLRRSQVRSSLKDVLGRARLRRRAIDDISSGITHFLTSGGPPAKALRRLAKSRATHANGLASSDPFTFSIPPRLGGFPVVLTEQLPEPAEVDYQNEEVRIDTDRPEWDWSLVLFDRRLEVVNKRGGPNLPIAELDLKADRILVNWEHPVRNQMDERGFLRTALSWALAKEAAQADADLMMDLAVRLLAFRTAGTDG